VGQDIYAVVLDLDREAKRVYLTHKELLGTWAENAGRFQAGMTVPGIVRGLKEYGAFVELAPNLSGLAEVKPGLEEGDRVSVYLKAILPDRMKIKLLAIDRLPPLPGPPPLTYFITGGRMEQWKYAPAGCSRLGAETVFFG
jgi:small subunit ribosomal protein S1